MMPEDGNFTTGNPALGKHVNDDQDAASVTTDDQTLLKALQSLIVRMVVPMQENDSDQIHTGPEAEKLIIALQEFISSIVMRYQSGVQNTIIEVNVDEEDEEFLSDLEEGDFQEGEPDLDDEDGGLPSKQDIFSYESDEDVIGNSNSRDLVTSEKLPLTFKEELQRALQEHVFNKIPIRLLCFESKDSSFRIALFERGTIYEHLVSVLEDKIHEAEFLPKENFFGRMETDEEVIQRLISKYASYAILSHTWLRTAPGEVTYGDWRKGLVDVEGTLGYQKLVNFCRAAWKDHGLTFGWMDTVCINKESSTELDESIRSMYNWYSRAAVCITYLAETETLANMYLDPWFTRGWTLQELLAPDVIRFYNGDWKRLVHHSYNDKEDAHITNQIERATTISKFELANIRKASISRRMQLAANRKVTREEDTAYSLMGIFNVSISTAYGEGAAHAFSRLLQEILASREDVLDILNWAGDLPFSKTHTTTYVLPSSPEYYTNRSSIDWSQLERPTKPLTLTHLGLRVPVVLMPGISIQATVSQHDPIGNYNATVNFSPVGYHRTIDDIPTTYSLLDSRVSGCDGWKEGKALHQMTFAVFNFMGAANITSIPKTCIALGLNCFEDAGEVSNAGGFLTIRTSEPIVFKLKKTTVDKNVYDNTPCWDIKADELPKHGMQLINMYL